MFSGIINAIGHITDIRPQTAGLSLTIDAGPLDLSDLQNGDSIACNGVCLTVTQHTGQYFHVDVSPETLSCTVSLNTIGPINLEKALRLNDRLGGHLVSGHVDGIGTLVHTETIGENRHLTLRVPEALLRYIAPKGSLTLNGVSLTTNALCDDLVHINLIPHTLQHTTLNQLQPGDPINLEVDLLARYCERILSYQHTL